MAPVYKFILNTLTYRNVLFCFIFLLIARIITWFGFPTDPTGGKGVKLELVLVFVV